MAVHWRSTSSASTSTSRRGAAARSSPRLQFPVARLHATATIDAHAVRVPDFEWSAEPTLLEGSASLERPFRDAAKLAAALRGGPIPVLALRDAVSAAAPQNRGLRERIAALRAGSLEEFTLRADATPIADWRAFADAPLDAWPESLEIETRVAGGEVALVDSPPLRDLGARVRMHPDRIEISDARARLGAGRLPELN